MSHPVTPNAEHHHPALEVDARAAGIHPISHPAASSALPSHTSLSLVCSGPSYLLWLLWGTLSPRSEGLSSYFPPLHLVSQMAVSFWGEPDNQRVQGTQLAWFRSPHWYSTKISFWMWGGWGAPPGVLQGINNAQLGSGCAELNVDLIVA